jgi:hypothetical protein
LEVTQAPKVTLPWPHYAINEARVLMGPDPWPYGISANRHVLDAQIRWSRLDHLQARPIEVEELFATDCLNTLCVPKTSSNTLELAGSNRNPTLALIAQRFLILSVRIGGVFAIAAVVDHFSDAVVKNPIVGQSPEIRS